MTTRWQRLAGVVAFAATSLAALPARADQEANKLCAGANGFLNQNGGCASKSNLTQPLRSHAQTITQTLLIVAGAVAVIIIILSGIRYITSTGDAGRVQQSKDTLLYAVIGLVVVIAAYAIVHAVATRI